MLSINTKINVPDVLNDLSHYFTPKIIGKVNDVYLKVVKILGEKVPWHNHKNEDELFFILKGTLMMEIENKPAFLMKRGDLYVVKKGINHRVSSQSECHLMLIENKTTRHTGEVESEITKSIKEQRTYLNW